MRQTERRWEGGGSFIWLSSPFRKRAREVGDKKRKKKSKDKGTRDVKKIGDKTVGERKLCTIHYSWGTSA